MHPSIRRVRALLAPLVGGILLLQGLLVPMLDGADSGRRVVLESEHDAGTCLTGHDHTICIQVGANQAITSGEVRLHQSHVAAAEASHGVPTSFRSATAVFVHGPRGPPIA